MGFSEILFGKKTDKRKQLSDMADKLFQECKYDEALLLYKEADNIFQSRPTITWDYLRLKIGLCNFHLNNFSQCIWVLEMLRSLNEEILFPLAVSYFKIGEYKKSKELFGLGVDKNYGSLVNEYSKLFNPNYNPFIYWNHQDEVIVKFLFKNINKDIFSNNLEFDSEDLAKLKDVKTLNLSCWDENFIYVEDEFHNGWTLAGKRNNDKIKDIKFCKYLPSLRVLNLKGQEISNLEGLEGLKEIAEINASNSNVINLDGLKNCFSLRSLDLNSPYMSHVKLNLKPLESLKIEILDLGKRNIEDYSVLNSFQHLKRLSLYMTNFSDFSDIKNLSKLEFLNISFTQIKSLPLECDFFALKKIIVSFKPIENDKKLFYSRFPNCLIEEKSLDEGAFISKTKSSPEDIDNMIDSFDFN